jgi:hypothetical protein
MAEIQKPADQAEKTNIQKAGEAAKEGGVIAGQKNQEVHGQAFEQAHQNDKTLSEPDMIAIEEGETVAQYNARVAQIQANRFGFFDSAAEVKDENTVLIAQAKNDTPGGSIVNGVWNAAVFGAEISNRAENSNSLIPKGAAMDYFSGIVNHPERYTKFGGTSLDLASCENAFKAFGLDQMKLPHDLIPGLIWNELLHRKPNDAEQDRKAAKGEMQDSTTSVGPAQMQLRNIALLAAKYPQLQQLGDPVHACLDPAKAPYFVAAYLRNEAENISEYNRRHQEDQAFKVIPINSDTLAYRYNPDVFRDSKGELRSLEPWEKIARRFHPLDLTNVEFPTEGVIERSHHVRKVREAVKEVQRDANF